MGAWSYGKVWSSDLCIEQSAVLNGPRLQHVHQSFKGPSFIPQRGISSACSNRFIFENHIGGCQNYGPFLGPYYNTGP